MVRGITVLGLALLACPAAVADRTTADARSIEIAEKVLERMGGREAWEATRIVRWDFFGGRRHYWDRLSGDVRIEADKRLVLMNINTKRGRVWEDGRELTGSELDEALLAGHEWWVNDSYWMFMPYKLLDPGVTLRYVGERPMKEGGAADVVELTFAPGVGYTPENRYEVAVSKTSGLVEEWSFFAKAEDKEPRFVLPWVDWKRFGRIQLATTHVRDPERNKDWNIAVFDTLPEAVFHSPEPFGR